MHFVGQQYGSESAVVVCVCLYFSGARIWERERERERALSVWCVNPAAAEYVYCKAAFAN